MADEAPRLICRPEVIALVPEALAREADAFPLDHSGGAITFALAGPLSHETRDTLRFVLNREIREVIAPIEAIRKALDDHYGVANEIEVLLFYDPRSARTLDDGTIEMGAPGWESGQGRQTHWTGATLFAPDDPDYGLWRWVLSQRDRFALMVTPSVLETIREAYRREQTGEETGVQSEFRP